MSALKRKSNVALIIGIVIMLLLIPIWYGMIAPFLIVLELGKFDLTTSYEGTYKNPVYGSISILIKAHAYAEEAKGDNIFMKMEINATYKSMKLDELSANLTYVFNKFTRENVENAPEADKPREGYDYIYSSHLKAGEDIPKAWLENLNTTAILEFEESVVEEGITLCKYSAEKTITKEMYISFYGTRNCALTSTKTILVEPLSGLWIYTENETFSLVLLDAGDYELLYLNYNSTADAKTQRLTEAKTVYNSMQFLELYIPSILGVIAVILTIALTFNVRRLKRKKHACMSADTGPD